MSIPRRPATAREVPDETLMGRYADGDDAAFDELFLRYEPRAYGYFASRTGSADRAQDLYQELFLRIHRARDSYDPARAFSPWFFQIAHRLLIDDARRAYRSQEQPYGNLEPRAIAATAADGMLEREALARVLEPLSADERYVLVSAKAEGVSYQELAVQLGKSVDAVKQMASRAMRRLRAVHRSSAAGALPHAR